MLGHAVTANRLSDGAVVYAAGSTDGLLWSTDFATAEIVSETGSDLLLGLAAADVAANLIVEPYAIPVGRERTALGTREWVRALGRPTVRFGTDASPSEAAPPRGPRN